MSMREPIEELLPLYVTGDLDAVEKRRVETWLAASAENRRVLAEVEDVVRGLAGSRFEDEATPPAIAAEELIERADTTVLRRRIRRTWIAAAAAVLLAFFLGGWVERTSEKAPSEEQMVEERRSEPSKRAREAWRVSQRAGSGFGASLAGLKALSRR